MLEIVAQPIGQLGVPVACAVLALGVVGMVRGELGELVRCGLSVGRQANALARHGQVLRFGLPFERHRKPAGTGWRLCSVIGRLRRLLKNVWLARARERVGVG